MVNLKMLAASDFVDNYGDDWVARFVEKGLPTALLGIVIVFVVLAIIWGFLEIFRYVFYTVPERNKKSNSAAAPVKAQPKPQSKTAPQKTVAAVTNDAEVVAAIIAAITAMRAEENVASPSSFRVVSFRKR